MVGESTGGHVWLERLTDDANVWLTAVRMEEQADYAKAAALYLDDATKCLEEGTIVRAALSVTCAADCFARLGLTSRSRRLYHVAAMSYWDNADARIGSSVRESLWSLQEAYESFVLAGEEENAEQVRAAFESMARRANPFIGERDSFKLPLKQELAAKFPEPSDPLQAQAQEEPPELVGKFEALLGARERQQARDNAAKESTVPPPHTEMETIDAQGFVGQLG
jgi:hypothetical protein